MRTPISEPSDRISAAILQSVDREIRRVDPETRRWHSLSSRPVRSASDASCRSSIPAFYTVADPQIGVFDGMAPDKPTREEMHLAFEDAILNMQAMLAKGVQRGIDISPLAMLLLDHVPDLAGTPLATERATEGPPNGIQALLVNPGMITPKGLPIMPPHVFWVILRALGHKLGAFGTIIGMEAWTAESADREEMPKDLSTYEGRKESLVVTTEREGEKRIFTALIKRENDVVSFEAWTEGRPAQGRVFNTVPANTLS